VVATTTSPLPTVLVVTSTPLPLPSVVFMFQNCGFHM
jgi:hypothetical protein